MLEVTTLVERCRAGDALAWEALVRRFQPRVQGTVLHYLRDAEEARDVTQDVFVRVYRRLGTFAGGDFVPWLLQVARNASLDRLRRRRARPPQHGVPIDDGVELVAAGSAPDEDAERVERKRMLYRALGRVSEHHREILLLKDIEGLKFEEISAMLDLPVGTLKSRSNRARLELATRLRELDPSWGSAR